MVHSPVWVLTHVATAAAMGVCTRGGTALTPVPARNRGHAVSPTAGGGQDDTLRLSRVRLPPGAGTGSARRIAMPCCEPKGGRGIVAPAAGERKASSPVGTGRMAEVTLPCSSVYTMW